MELTQLRYFYQVYQAGSIRSASGELNVTQQAISKQIQNLEEELGVSLFMRSKSGVSPTEYGHMLAEKAQNILPELDELMYSIQKRHQIISGVVRLGVQCWQMIQGGNLRFETLKEFAARYPQVRLVSENLSPAECCRGVREGRLDLCVASMPEHVRSLELTPLRDFQWYMLMAAGHPLAERELLTVEDLSGERLILAGEESGMRNQIEQALIGREKPEFVDVEDYVFDLLGQEVLGRGALMLTLTAQRGLFNPDRFVMVPIQGDIWLNRLYLCRAADKAMSPAVEALYCFLTDQWTNLRSPGEI